MTSRCSVTAAAVLVVAVHLCPAARSQELPAEGLPDQILTAADDEKPVADLPEVDVAPTAADSQIAARLQSILDATGWFTESEVRVEEGVVFLTGEATTRESKEWAGNLARRTQDVVAVVNKLQIEQPSPWNLEPASEGLRELRRDTIAVLPWLAFGVLILIVAWIVAGLVAIAVRRFLQGYLSSALLRNVLARAVGFLVILLGVYIVLRVSGLTRLAVTLLGGTGLIGLVIGIAFRDITENFLASIFLSTRRPFYVGDLVEIVKVVGYVQRLTTRATVLMTLDGNVVEIPNATVYKNTICNYSTNKNRREDFVIGIGYDVPIMEAQQVALRVLHEHPAVLKHPEPWALVDDLGAAAVSLRIYFWLDGSKHSWLKVRSSVIRLVKRAFQEAGISIPDEAREIIFPQGVPVQMQQPEAEPAPAPPARIRQEALRESAAEPPATSAEGGLASEAGEIENQMRESRQLEGDNLLSRDPPAAAR